MELATATARAARDAGRRTLLDAGSWKPGTQNLLPWIDVAACSADFHPPGAHTSTDTLQFLGRHGVAWTAVTQGGGPIVWAGPDDSGTIAVPTVPVADTLGAGDILHGALTHHLSDKRHLTSQSFVQGLHAAALIASHACASFGTRAWMR
jgi:sugar/nucleoside kinase (ribokinase family)